MTTLVVEGGAARATYASGVAAALQKAGFVPDAIYGTSAGGAIAAWYAAGLTEQGTKTWDAITDRNLLSWRRALVGRPVLDFARLYSDYYPRVFGMDVARLRAAPFPAYATLTDADSAESVYVDLRRAEDPMRVLHATSALPLVSESPVEIGGRRFVDGGVTDPIPIAKALADGHRDLVVVLNRPKGPRPPESAAVVRLVARRFPALREHVAKHHVYHQEAIALAESPPAGARVRIVRPAADLGLSRLTRDVAKLRAAVEKGRQDGARLAQGLELRA